MVDVDGTLGDFLFPALAIFSELLGFAPPWDEAETLGLRGWFARHGVGGEEFQAAFEHVEPLAYAGLHPYAGALRATRAWTSRGGRIIWLTARPSRYDRITRQWLKEHGFPEAPLISGVKAHHKGMIAAQNHAVILIDDSPWVLRSARSGGFGGTLWAVDHGYNRDVLADRRIHWVKGWARRNQAAATRSGAREFR